MSSSAHGKSDIIQTRASWMWETPNSFACNHFTKETNYHQAKESLS